MKFMKKAAALSVSAALLLQFTSVAPLTFVSADTAPATKVIDGLTYVYVPDSPAKNECTVQLVYDDTSKHVTKHDTIVVPEKIDSYTVTAIGDDKQGIAISNNSNSVHVETIKLPNTIKEIHKRALVDSDLPYFTTLYVNINDLETVGVDAFGLYTRITDIYAYDEIDKAYYQTNDDLDKFRELVGIDHIKFQNIEGKLDGFMISEAEYKKDKCVNGRLEFNNEIACSPYSRRIGCLFAQEAVKENGFDNPNTPMLHKLEKIYNYIFTNTRYSALFTYNEDPTKSREMANLYGSAMSNIGYHTGVCGSYAHAFEQLCGAAMGYDIINKYHDITCVGVTGHALNGVRLVHSDSNEGYYIVDLTSSVFMQGAGKGVGEYGNKDSEFKYAGYIYGDVGSIRESDESTHPIYVAEDPDLYLKGISYVYLRDETKDTLHIEMRDKNDKSNKFIDFTSYPVSSPDFHLGELPKTKCGDANPGGSPLNLYVEPNMYYEFSISNSKGEAVFSGDGDYNFKLGDAEYEFSLHTRAYNSETPYGKVIPHTAYNDYFEVVIKQLSDDPKPDTYPTVTTVHKTTTTTTTKITTTTKKPTTTTTAKPTTTTKKPTTTTTAKPTTTTKKPTTTTTAKPTTTTKKPTTTTTAKPTTTTKKPTTTTTAKPTTTTKKPTTTTTAKPTTTTKKPTTTTTAKPTTTTKKPTTTTTAKPTTTTKKPTTTTTAKPTTTTKKATTTTKKPTTTTTTKLTVTKYGDANCDKILNMADVVLIMQSQVNPDKFGINGTDKSHITRQGLLNADCAGGNDGVTNLDALAIQKFLIDLIHELPEK